jgi:F0F1-type ATP synthase assembly protein I
MGESPRQKSADQTTQRPSSAVLLLITTALDTTWRTLVPGIVGVIVGIWLDHTWHTTPMMTIIGLVMGIVLSVVLIYRQFKAVQR